jgi:hypothetical protein
MNLRDEFISYLRSWIWDKKLDKITEVISSLPEERLFSAVLEIRSDAPTTVGRALVNLTEVRQFIKDFIRQDEFANYVLEPDEWDPDDKWGEDHIIREIMSNNLVIKIGQKFMETDFWKKNQVSIKKQQRALKRVDQVMQG